jgi:hypothetical protein
MSSSQARAYRIADNKTGDLATWDLELLPGELAELQQLDIDLSLLGFGEDELAKLLDPGVKAGLTDPDAIPDPRPGKNMQHTMLAMLRQSVYGRLAGYEVDDAATGRRVGDFLGSKG